MIESLSLGETQKKKFPPYEILVMEEEGIVFCYWKNPKTVKPHSEDNAEEEHAYFFLRYELHAGAEPEWFLREKGEWNSLEKGWEKKHDEFQILSNAVENRFSSHMKKGKDLDSTKNVVEKFSFEQYTLPKTLYRKLKEIKEFGIELAPKIDVIGDLHEVHYLKALFSRDLPQILLKFVRTPKAYQNEKEEEFLQFLMKVQEKMQNRKETVDQGLILDFETKLKIADAWYTQKNRP